MLTRDGIQVGTSGLARDSQVAEADLIRRCRAGDAEAFAPIVAAYRDRLVDLAFRMLGDMDEAEGAAQQALVRAYEGMARFRGDARLTTWLYRIATNECLMRLRRTPRTVPLSRAEQIDSGAWKRDGRRLEAADRVGAVLPRLPGALRAVLVMREMHEMPYEEIADALHVPVGTVRSRLWAARRRFAAAWRELYGEE